MFAIATILYVFRYIDTVVWSDGRSSTRTSPTRDPSEAGGTSVTRDPGTDSDRYSGVTHLTSETSLETIKELPVDLKNWKADVGGEGVSLKQFKAAVASRSRTK